MAIYHCSVKIIGRSSGRSSVAAAAYRAGQKMTNERDGITHDYTRKIGVVHFEIMLPDYAPIEYDDRATLWNAVEKTERRLDSQTAREVEVALPVEFSMNENIQLVRNYIAENFTSKGMCADFSIHDNPNNPHAHIMLTMRDVSPSGFEKKNRDWNNKNLLEQWRENWANECNRALAEKGMQSRIDHRTLEAQGLERMPTIHVGRSSVRKAHNERIILFNEQYKPQNVSLFMNELNEGYTIIKNHLSELSQGERDITRIKDSIKTISKRTEDVEMLYNALQHTKAERNNMGRFQSKREIDARIESLETAYRHSWDYFERNYKVAPDQVHNEIIRLERECMSISQNRDNATISRYQEKMREFEKEYKRQRLLAQIRADRKEIFDRLDRVDMRLNRITADDRREIAQGLRSSQIALIEGERHRQPNVRGAFDWVR